MNHPKNHELQEFVDNLCDEKTRSVVSLHLQTCTECRSQIDGFAKLSKIIRRIPSERASKSFTDRVMRKIGIADSPSFLWFLLKNIAPVFGLIIVIGVVYAALTFTGIVGRSGAYQSDGALTAVYGKIGNEITTATSAFMDWFKGVFPFLYSRTSYGLVIMLIVVIIAALLDRYLLVPIFRRRL